MIHDDASLQQIRAADPAGSVWLSANAGSGKTRVLTDRVARLLLQGTPPERILCLTYTKAAAAEMQNRLFKTLGAWSMLDDAALAADLTRLGIAGQHAPRDLASARRLFARAIEAPGGLRIQTIHSFCAALLRRFPLEAGVSPRFTEMDERTARQVQGEILEEMADDRDEGAETLRAMADHISHSAVTSFLGALVANRALFKPAVGIAGALAAFNLPAGFDETALLASVLLGDEPKTFVALAEAVVAAGTPSEKTNILPLARKWAVQAESPSIGLLSELEDKLLFGAGAKSGPFTAKIGKFPTKGSQTGMDAALESLNALMARVEAARPTRLSLLAARKMALLHRFADVFLDRYTRAKAARGFLDFDDLITLTVRLLSSREVAAWLLFRLDGGIDHILVDEAQDTSPLQWRVIAALTEEFTAGAGAREGSRTLFVVGDKKQSIYSFQGADLSVFDAMHRQFETAFRSAGLGFMTLPMLHSFRSSPAVLRVVDHIFGNDFPAAMGEDAVQHLAYDTALPGRVDLWPVVEPREDPAPEDWENPVDLTAEDHHHRRLARKIADWICGNIDAGTRIPEKGGASHAMHEGDVLILVQRRKNGLFEEIITACKAAGLAIAGADRMLLGAEMAVRDLTALLSFLDTPEDDLSLAAALRSPLLGIDEAALFDLAATRPGYLWEALRAAADRYPVTAKMLSDLLDAVDFLRPYELIERILTRHGGRHRLIARLGPEAEDGIDAFLSQALAYEATEVPSLTGFLGWIAADQAEVRRQVAAEARAVRVMTVHGAKGLEANVVILADTADRRSSDKDAIVAHPSGAGMLRPKADDRPPGYLATAERRLEDSAEESLRLLYVALTRARVWTVIAAAGEVSQPAAWYNLAREGLARAGTEMIEGGILRHSHGNWPLPSLEADISADEHTTPPLPDWAQRAAPATPKTMPPLSPSALGGAKVLFAPEEGDGAEAMARGTALHLLLDRLPRVDPIHWPALAARLSPAFPDLLAEASALIVDPALSEIFAPGALSEVSLAAPLGQRHLFGAIDRLLVRPDRILAVDFKTNRQVPSDSASVPEGLLRQMGAYGAALAQIYPGRRIDLAILWTETRHLMPLDPDIVRAALDRALSLDVPGPEP